MAYRCLECGAVCEELPDNMVCDACGRCRIFLKVRPRTVKRVRAE